MPVVRGLVYSPAARRRRYMILIERCPWCGAMHFAWSWLLPARVMYRRCGSRHRRYVVAPTLVREPGRRKAVMRHVRG